MKVSRLRLANFKCYASVDVSLAGGVTVIHGPNGAGKSSLLDAVFFALYGATALDVTLDDIVTRGADDAEVELWFTHAGRDYHIERRVRATGERAQTASCVLETPEDTVEGATDVGEAVAALLRMDVDAFVNCAYVRQGEVNKLINATPDERQRMLDDLLQLGVLETYRTRAANARLGVEDITAEVRGRLAQVRTQVEEKADKDLHGTLNALETERAAVVEDIDRYESSRSEAQESLSAARSMVEQHEERREALESLTDEIETIQDRIAETERERDAIAERIEERLERAEELAADRDDRAAALDLDTRTADAVDDRLDARSSELESIDDRHQAIEIERTETAAEYETATDRASELEAEAETARERAGELAAEVEEARTALDERHERRRELEDRIEAIEAEFEVAPVEPEDAEDHRASLVDERDALREERSDRQAALETARHRIEHAEGLLEAGKCPECGQSVDESPHVDSLDDDRDRVADLEAAVAALDDQLETKEQAIARTDDLLEAIRERDRLRTERDSLAELLAEREAAIDETNARAADQHERAEELAGQAEAKREVASAAETRLEALVERSDELASERESVQTAIDDLEQVAECIEQLETVEAAVDRLREKREDLAAHNEERRETLAGLRDRRTELADAADDDAVESARQEATRAADYLEQVEAALESRRDRRDELQGRIGGIETELEELEALRERRAALDERLERIESLHGETEDLEAVYADLRAELRQQNIAVLERLLNETFDLVYRNDAYARIELDADYALTVYQKDGEALDPEQLSGGERALFNLSLRTAIYRLLAEGIDGGAPMPPLILDEPTVFLDAGHVSQLVALVESMRNLGVEQIIVVSHDEELVGAADALLTVRKDPTSNRSAVEPGGQPEVVAD